MENSIFSVYDPRGVKLLTRVKLEFSHLNEHKFKHGFNDLNVVLMIQLILYKLAELKLKLQNTSSCVFIFPLLKDLKSLISLRKLIQFFLIQMQEI